MSEKSLTLHDPLISELRGGRGEKNKMKGYNDLKRELKKIRDMPVKVIPVVVIVLGITPRKLKQWLRNIGIETKNSGIAENYHLIFCKDPPKCS